MRAMGKSPLKVQELINRILGMNPSADVFWYDANGGRIIDFLNITLM